MAAAGCIPESKRVQVPSAPGFYRSCADALTDGFGPQSGLVQRGVIKYRGRQQTYRISDCKRGRRFAAGCIKRLCSLRSGGDRGEWYSRKQEGSGAFGARVQAFTGLPPWNARVRPAERAGSKGSYKCGLSATPFGGFATTFPPQAVGQQSSAKL